MCKFAHTGHFGFANVVFIYIVVSYFFHYFYAIFDHCVGERFTVGKKCQKIWKKVTIIILKNDTFTK